MNPMVPMTSAPVPAMSEAVFALTLALLLLAPLAIAGVALVNTGLARSRSTAQALLGYLALWAVTAIVFALVGATFAGTLGTAEIAVHAAGKTWGVLGLGPFLMHGLGSAAPQAQLALLFEFMAVAMAAMIPWGSGADRWRLPGGCAAAAVLAGFVFPLTAHWIWGGGWLAALGANFGLGAGFLDGGGAASRARFRRPRRIGPGVDRRTAQRQISARGPVNRDTRPQCCLCSVRLPVGAGGLAGVERGRRGHLAARSTRGAAGHGHQYLALGCGGASSHLLRYASPLWQAGRKSLRQRLAGWARHFHRLRGAGHAGGSHLRRSRGRLLYAAAGGSAGAGDLHRRPVGRDCRARRIGAVGTGSRGLLCARRPGSSRRNWWALPRCWASCCLSSICSLPCSTAWSRSASILTASASAWTSTNWAAARIPSS